jgi:catechol 2,3-dioxygenase-like lactoylglutathione lyase family enzyme
MTTPALDHVTVVADDFEASRTVYAAVLRAAALVAHTEYVDPEGEDGDPGTVAAVGFGPPGGAPVLWLVAGPVPTTGAHLAVAVADEPQVDAAYTAGLAAGARAVQAPREWEARYQGYYGAQLADASGNVIEVLRRRG